MLIVQGGKCVLQYNCTMKTHLKMPNLISPTIFLRIENTGCDPDEY